jgi:hypothetical protein
MHLLTPQGIAQRIRLATHFLHRKDREFEELQSEIEYLRSELVEGKPSTRAEISALLLEETAPLGKTG